MSLIKPIIDSVQTKQIRFLFGAVAFIGGISGIMIYFQKRKFSKEHAELLALDKEIKTITLAKLKNDTDK